MSFIDPNDWYTGEFEQQTEQAAATRPRPKQRTAPGKLPPAQAKAVADVNARFAHVTLNDDVPL